MKTILVLTLLIVSRTACAQERFTQEQLDAHFYYDLGPAQIDVSLYPKTIQEKYKIFSNTCSQCHTLARPINSPLAQRKDWKRYVRRMHAKTKAVAGATINGEDAKAIVDFLSYDAHKRKVENKISFDAKTDELKRLFAEVRKERSAIQTKEDNKKIKESAPYTGVK